MDCSIVARRLRGQVGEFSGVLSAGLPKTARRFVGEMLYGLQAKQSVVLTQIARALEEDVSTKKVHERLCRIMASHVIKAAKRIFGVPGFHYYAIADGMSALFQRHPGRLTPGKPANPLQPGLFPQGP